MQASTSPKYLRGWNKVWPSLDSLLITTKRLQLRVGSHDGSSFCFFPFLVVCQRRHQRSRGLLGMAASWEHISESYNLWSLSLSFITLKFSPFTPTSPSFLWPISGCTSTCLTLVFNHCPTHLLGGPSTFKSEERLFLLFCSLRHERCHTQLMSSDKEPLKESEVIVEQKQDSARTQCMFEAQGWAVQHWWLTIWIWKHIKLFYGRRKNLISFDYIWRISRRHFERFFKKHFINSAVIQMISHTGSSG